MTVRRPFRALLAGCLLALTACDRTRPARADVGGAGGTVDSVVLRETELAAFRRGLPEPDSLAGGRPSQGQLVRAFARAVESCDTAALMAMVLTRAEFAYLYYPTNPQALPPYDLGPGLMWFMLETRSRLGLSSLLEERGGRALGIVRHDCDGQPSRQGGNTVWGPCVVQRIVSARDTVTEQLFGPIVERDGRFKFVSLANKL